MIWRGTRPFFALNEDLDAMTAVLSVIDELRRCEQ
jgi:hypothetical protein